MNILLYLLVVTSTACTLVAQLLLKRVIANEATRSAMAEGGVQFVLVVASTPLTWLALAIQASGYVTWLFVLSKEKMAIAFALSGSFFYLLVGFSSWALFSERLSGQQWLGITLISLGVLFVAYRP